MRTKKNSPQPRVVLRMDSAEQLQQPLEGLPWEDTCIIAGFGTNEAMLLSSPFTRQIGFSPCIIQENEIVVPEKKCIYYTAGKEKIILCEGKLYLSGRVPRGEKSNGENAGAESRALESRMKKLAQTNEELSRFVYTASHDLQEPLHMISGLLRLFQKQYGDLHDEAGQHYIEMALSVADRMDHFVRDLLEYSLTGTSNEKKVDVDLNAVIDETQLLFAEQVNQTGATIVSADLPVVKGRKFQLYQLIQNLVGNALKYHAASAPNIVIGCSDEGSSWKFSVKDNGIGIAPAYHEKVFLTFHRLHGKNEFSGSGIGLATCRRIVEGHGGRIWVTSSPGKGAVFYFTLPK